MDASQANATNYQHDFTGTVTVNGAVPLVGRDNWAKEMGFTGTLTGAGSLTYSRGAGDGRYNANGKLIISGDASGFTGMITMNASNGYSAGLICALPFLRGCHSDIRNGHYRICLHARAGGC
ncbi:MAG: hypothetical protein ACLT38_01440 [Akkermansia sp.]